MRRLPLALWFSFSLVLLLACDEDEASPPAAVDAADAGKDASTPTEGHEGHDAGVPEDAGTTPIPIRCTDDELAANDRTDGGALEISFELGANPKQYTNRCATVKVGATVTFTGSFLQHPLEAAGGDTPSPIPYTAADPPNERLEVTFPSPGTFGYQCEFHPTLMFGAIRVVP